MPAARMCRWSRLYAAAVVAEGLAPVVRASASRARTWRSSAMPACSVGLCARTCARVFVIVSAYRERSASGSVVSSLSVCVVFVVASPILVSCRAFCLKREWLPPSASAFACARPSPCCSRNSSGVACRTGGPLGERAYCRAVSTIFESRFQHRRNRQTRKTTVAYGARLITCSHLGHAAGFVIFLAGFFVAARARAPAN